MYPVANKFHIETQSNKRLSCDEITDKVNGKMQN